MLVLYEAGRSRFSSSLPSPELTKAAAEQERCPGGRTGAGDAVLGWLQHQGCQLACAQSTETLETPQSPCLLHAGGSQTGTLKESGISLLRHLKGVLHLTDQRHSRALVTPASLLGIPHKRLWAGGFAQVHFTVLTKKKPKQYKPHIFCPRPQRREPCLACNTRGQKQEQGAVPGAQRAPLKHEKPCAALRILSSPPPPAAGKAKLPPCWGSPSTSLQGWLTRGHFCLLVGHC